MKVALVHPFAWPDVRRGGERYLDDLQWYLRGKGHEVDVITGTDSRSQVTQGLYGSDRRLRHLPELVIWRANVKLRKPDTFGGRAFPSLLRNRYDIVHALMPTAALAARAAGQRVAFTLLG
ncbi:MAG: glycosyltransferase, partial [Actinobacteria bacterium]|nr:glycosyltransferase [Actinomycetota bacterium]